MQYIHIELQSFGGPECLAVVEETELPEPQRGQVRVKVLAAGAGFTDTIIRDGKYPGVKQKPPFTLGYDWVGVVDKCGAGVTCLEPGQTVADMSIIGGYAQYLCADADAVVPCPDGLDAASAVCMILPYTTAWQMLTRECSLVPGDKILVHAGGGAVGSAMLELARELSLEVFATASAAKHGLVRSLGGTPIDYRSEDFVSRTIELSGGGVDAVFDPLGGASWDRSYRCLRRGGKLVGYGALQVSTGEETIPRLLAGFAKLMVYWKLLPNGRTSGFYNIQSRRDKHPAEFTEDVTHLMSMLGAGSLHPVVAERTPLRMAADIHRKIDSAELQGRAVLMCQDDQAPMKP
jgi:NADPH:quinone reductase-like Zn-dependent oxidoreductase